VNEKCASELPVDFVFSGGRTMAKGGRRWGAGRPGWRLVGEHCRRIDVRVWHRAGTLREGFNGSWSWHRGGEHTGSIGYSIEGACAMLRYSADGLAITERVRLETTPCHFGGWRTWLRCPRCASRVAVLYMRSARFACRGCQRVAYASESEDACGRSWRKQSKIEARLGEHWQRPKGMHTATHERLLNAICACEQQREDGLARWINKLGLFAA
jgi:hypothetical protein